MGYRYFSKRDSGNKIFLSLGKKCYHWQKFWFFYLYSICGHLNKVKCSIWGYLHEVKYSISGNLHELKYLICGNVFEIIQCIFNLWPSVQSETACVSQVA